MLVYKVMVCLLPQALSKEDKRCTMCPLHPVAEREVSSIGKGICVLLGITREDTIKEAEWM